MSSSQSLLPSLSLSSSSSLWAKEPRAGSKLSSSVSSFSLAYTTTQNQILLIILSKWDTEQITLTKITHVMQYSIFIKSRWLVHNNPERDSALTSLRLHTEKSTSTKRHMWIISACIVHQLSWSVQIKTLNYTTERAGSLHHQTHQQFVWTFDVGSHTHDRTWTHHHLPGLISHTHQVS
jgi:hypothetical protein